MPTWDRFPGLLRHAVITQILPRAAMGTGLASRAPRKALPMLDFVYYPVSAVLWFWHTVFGSFLGADSGAAWTLSVVFLVFTVRVLLYRPTVNQVRTTRTMQKLQPQIRALQHKHGKDRQKLALEMQELQREHGFNPLLGCLPILVQIPVFIGLFHVLRSFNRTGTGLGQLGLSPELNAVTSNYVFSAEDVQSFLSARLLGAPISGWITQPQASLEAFAEFGGVPSVAAIAAVAVPLMIVAGIATHLNARFMLQRQSPELADNPQTVIVNRLALWVFPFGAVVGGPFLPVAVLIYWVTNNIWTCFQQHLVFRRIDAEEARAAERRAGPEPTP